MPCLTNGKGKCTCCGFQQWWSKGLRPKVLQTNADGSESVRNGVSQLWEQRITWDTIKSGDGGGDSAEDSDLRHTVSGTITEYLDACETVHDGWTPHRFHAVQAKVAEVELEQNLTPGKLKADSDWSENGEIVVKQQMQSEYWSIKYYSLFISITGFLVASEWKGRTSILKQKAEVTVQPADAPTDSIVYIAGSRFATIEEGAFTAAESATSRRTRRRARGIRESTGRRSTPSTRRSRTSQSGILS